MHHGTRLGVALAVAVTGGWGFASTRAEPQARGARVASSATAPCLSNKASVECAIFRLDEIDTRLRALETIVQAQQSAPTRGLPGPPVGQLQDPGGKADADSLYLNQRIDAIARVVTRLVEKVNAR